MFPDSVLVNVVLFLAAQCAVWGYLRTGLIGHGVTLLIGTWALGDVALVARLAYGHTGWIYMASLAAFQVLALLGAGRLLFGRLWRHRPAVVAARECSFREAVFAELRGDDDAAREGFARLCRSDPWDAAARVALARVLRRSGRVRAARRLLHAAARVDAVGYGDLVTVELGLLDGDLRPG